MFCSKQSVNNIFPVCFFGMSFVSWYLDRMTVLQENVKETGDSQVDEAVLEGHLGIAKELLSFMSPEKKYELGSDEKKGINLVKVYCISCMF